MLAGLEVRVREAEENLTQLPPRKIIRQEFHRVRAERGDIAVGAGVLRAQRGDAVGHVVGDLGAELEAEDEGGGEQG